MRHPDPGANPPWRFAASTTGGPRRCSTRSSTSAATPSGGRWSGDPDRCGNRSASCSGADGDAAGRGLRRVLRVLRQRRKSTRAPAICSGLIQSKAPVNLLAPQSAHSCWTVCLVHLGAVWFSLQAYHYTQPNVSDSTRVSLDFRVVPGPMYDDDWIGSRNRKNDRQAFFLGDRGYGCPRIVLMTPSFNPLRSSTHPRARIHARACTQAHRAPRTAHRTPSFPVHLP